MELDKCRVFIMSLIGRDELLITSMIVCTNVCFVKFCHVTFASVLCLIICNWMLSVSTFDLIY